MNSGFPDGGFEVATTDPDPLSENALAEYEMGFRGAMARYHMADDDIDCMIDEAFPDASPAARNPGPTWTSEELNAFADECSVDFSKLWYMTD